MHKGRLEAFSDGVIAIIITIMVLEIRAPHDAAVSALVPLMPSFISYALSFIFIGIYWSNHHHLLQVAEKVSGPVLWANLHLLFWLSLIPFTTGWMGENGFPSGPVALYGVVLLLAGFAYSILTRTFIHQHRRDSNLVRALGKDTKGNISILIYACAIPLAFWHAWAAYGLYALVALMWLVPDRRIEKVMN